MEAIAYAVEALEQVGDGTMRARRANVVRRGDGCQSLGARGGDETRRAPSYTCEPGKTMPLERDQGQPSIPSHRGEQQSTNGLSLIARWAIGFLGPPLPRCSTRATLPGKTTTWCEQHGTRHTRQGTRAMSCNVCGGEMGIGEGV